MPDPIRYPGTVSVYEAVRTKPGARARLNQAGLTREYLDHGIGDAAHLLGVPVEYLMAMLERDEEPVD